MTTPHQPAPAGPVPSVADISAAMAALGIYASVPSEAELAQQAASVGGEQVLAAILANALYGAAIGTGMLTEGHMLEAGAGARELGLAREQVLKASGADGVGVMGVLHWQAGQVRQPLKNMAAHAGGHPVIGAAAHASSAVLDLLACTTVTSVDDPRAKQIPEQLMNAREGLEAAIAAIDALPGAVAALFPEDFPG
ncbi:DUF6245 family protein [Streptomyces sp. NPDC012765]|uniref:DUF6245 family protein n=1 Tax=Streptomyces sp. NPDC012765 TaxID=3155249 RepID=UPI0033DE713E